MQEIVLKSDFGIDLHTGAFNRCNLAQIRCNVLDERALNLAKAFDAPVIVNSNLLDGSLRSAVVSENIPMILFEAGEALRFDEKNIEIGLEGILNVMETIGMISNHKNICRRKYFIARSSSWLRAPQSGIHIPLTKLGKIVKKGDILGEISNPFGDHKVLVKAHENGIIIGMSKLPLANKGDALFHIACARPREGEVQNNIDNLEKIDFVNL
jgi:predicted deacylase